jgi:hypothetical protein
MLSRIAFHAHANCHSQLIVSQLYSPDGNVDTLSVGASTWDMTTSLSPVYVGVSASAM